MGNLLVHGGTRLSGEVVRDLMTAGIEPIVTVTRESARDLYPDSLNGRIRVGRLSPEVHRELVEEASVEAILDVTHPFADRISRQAMETAREKDLPYRFLDREYVLPEDHSLLRTVSDWTDAVRSVPKDGRVMLTIGIKHLNEFAGELDRERLIARVLPEIESVEAAREAEIPRKNILALWPPRTVDLEEELLRNYQVETLVSKDSGPSGNLPEKWDACRRTGTLFIVVERPELNYPDRTTDPDEAVAWGRTHAGS